MLDSIRIASYLKYIVLDFRAQYHSEGVCLIDNYCLRCTLCYSYRTIVNFKASNLHVHQVNLNKFGKQVCQCAEANSSLTSRCIQLVCCVEMERKVDKKTFLSSFKNMAVIFKKDNIYIQKSLVSYFLSGI